MLSTQKRLLLVIGFSAVLSSCGGGGSGSSSANPPPATPPPTSQTSTGIFVDAPVSGLTYMTDTHSGRTNADGEFMFEAGETIRFTFGGITIGTATANSVLTPLDLFPDQQEFQVAFMSFLQSLDSDSDLSNGISLTSATEDQFRAYVDERPNLDTFALIVERDDFASLAGRLTNRATWLDGAESLARFDEEILPLINQGLYTRPITSSGNDTIEPPPVASEGNCTSPVIPQRNFRWECEGFPNLRTSVFIRPGVTLLHMGSPQFSGETTCMPAGALVPPGDFTIASQNMIFYVQEGVRMDGSVIITGRNIQWVDENPDNPASQNYEISGQNIIVNGACFE